MMLGADCVFCVGGVFWFSRYACASSNDGFVLEVAFDGSSGADASDSLTSSSISANAVASNDAMEEPAAMLRLRVWTTVTK